MRSLAYPRGKRRDAVVVRQIDDRRGGERLEEEALRRGLGGKVVRDFEDGIQVWHARLQVDTTARTVPMQLVSSEVH